MEVKGYLIQNAEGSYLAKAHFWYHHDTYAEAYVHPRSELESILQASQHWQTKPERLLGAIYDPEKHNITIVGSLLKIRGLSVNDAMDLVRRVEE